MQVGKDGFSLEVASGRAAGHLDARPTPSRPAPGSRFINTNGRISAEPSADDKVELVAERTARASTDEAAQELMKQLEMREEAGDARVRVEVAGAPDVRLCRASRSAGWSRCRKGVIVDLRTANGRVTPVRPRRAKCTRRP